MPQGHIRHRFVQQLTMETKGLRTRGWNYELPLVFADVLLPMMENLQFSKDIHVCIERRMALWDQSRFASLVNDTVNSGRGGERRNRTGKLHGSTRGACSAGL